MLVCLLTCLCFALSPCIENDSLVLFHVAKKYADLHSKHERKGKDHRDKHRKHEPKKHEPKKHEPKKHEPKAKDHPEEEAKPAPPKEKKDPFGDLPPPKMVFDEWKRMYKNNDTATVAIPWFWENIDKEGSYL